MKKIADIFKNRILHIIIAFICVIVLIVFIIAAPEMGEKALFYETLKAFLVIGFGIYMASFPFVIAIKHIKETKDLPDTQVETRMETLVRILGKIGLIPFVTLALGILAIWAGGLQVGDCIKDYREGTVDIVLMNTSAEYYRSTSSRGYSHKRYTVKGMEVSTRENYKFRFGSLSNQAMDAINTDSDRIEMRIYPNSKAVVYMKICGSDQTIVLPSE